MNLRVIIVFLLVLPGSLPVALARAGPADHVGYAVVDGAIGPATADYLVRATRVAGEHGDACLIVRLDTPGGLLESTQQIVQSFYASPVPVVVYVAPSGANAGSAGCFITLAADVAVMAPHTSIGAAHPVSIGGTGGSGDDEAGTDDVMTEKMENFASSYIEAIAEKRGRNVEWARASVLESASITSEKALELGVIDLIAADMPDLLRQLDGRRVGERTLSVADATVSRIPMMLRERIFQTIWRPEVLFILMLVAIYGLIGELSNPGAILPGVVGTIALIVALYLSSILPVNGAGLALIGLAIVLFIIDIFAPSHGILTGGGIAAFALGTLMLFNRADPAFHLGLRFIVPGVVVTAAFFLFVVGKGLRAQRLPARTGLESMVGQTARALGPIDKSGGKVFVEGEIWNAVCEDPVAKDESVEVMAVEGLTLRVGRSS
jgi:membrane-bound serine protease (ClpP class)